MPTAIVVVIVIIVVLVLGAAAFLASTQMRRRRLQQRFGPEYERAVESHDSTREAEQELLEADRLLVLVMGERGYPTDGYEQQVADLSVEHAATIDRYRTAHDISARAEAKEASTEDLRQAMVHYRTLFTELLGDDGEARRAGVRATDHAQAEAETPVAGPARTRDHIDDEGASK
jgi:hypothetical protein